MNIIDEDYDKEPAKPTARPVVGAPNGYVGIKMSTGGKLSVPKEVYARNFKTADLVNLSMYADEILPEHIIPALNSLLANDVNVGVWPEPCINELLIKIYANYFTPMLTSIEFPWNEEDIAYLNSLDKQDVIKSLESGSYVPRVDIDIRNLHTFDLDAKVKDYVVIKHKVKGTSYKFVSYPRYGDGMELKKFVEENFEERDHRYDRIRRVMNIREKLLSEGKIDIPEMDNKEYLEWQMWEAEKAVIMAKATQALYLVAIDNKDVSFEPLKNRIKYLEDPDIDTVGLGKKLNKTFEEIKIGFDPEVEINNPITKSKCKRRFSFRLLDVLQAVQSSESDEYDSYYDD